MKIVLLLLALSAAPGPAQTNGTAPASTTVASSDKSSCRSLDVTGTIMSTRVCHKRSEWAAIDAANRNAMDNRRTSNTIERSQSGSAVMGADSFGQVNR